MKVASIPCELILSARRQLLAGAALILSPYALALDVPVSHVLEQLSAQGQNVVWSSVLLNVSKPVLNSAGSSIEQFSEALKPQGLRVKQALNGKDWVIVRRAVGETKQPPMSKQRVPLLIDEVVVRASRYQFKQREQEASSQTMLAEQLAALPKLGDDVLRPLTRLPGVSSVGVSAQPHIRGGYRDETLVLFNGIEIVEPYHLKNFQSLFSAINPAIVDRVDVYTGNFPSRYGNRLSGVMDIARVDAAQGDRAVIGLSLLNAWFSAMGTVQEGSGSWALSARRGNLDLIIDEINDDVGTPKYSDYYGQLSYTLPNGDDIEAGLLYLDGDVKLSDFSKGQLSESRYNNLFSWLKLDHEISETLYSHSSLAYTRIDRVRFSDALAPTELGEDALFDDDLEAEMIKFDQRFELAVSDTLSWEFGVGLQYNKARFEFFEFRFADIPLLSTLLGVQPQSVEQQQFPATDEDDVCFTGDEDSFCFLDQKKGLSAYGFGSVRWQINQYLSLDAGLRVDYQDYGNLNSEHQLAPRAALAYAPRPEHIFRLSMGRYVQAELIHELAIADGFTDYQSAQKSDQYVLGYEYQADNGLIIRAEAYSRKIANPKQRSENLFNPFVLVPELAADRVPLFLDKSKTQGFELSVDYNVNEQWWLWANYSRVKVRDHTIFWEHRAWNQENSVNAGFVWTGQKYQASLSASWHSGWRTTSLPSIVDPGESVFYVRNNATLPDFFSLDAKIARRWESSKQSTELFLEITNATDHNNVGSVDHDFTTLDNGQIEVQARNESLLPLIPVIGIVWTFH
ncbi:MAG: TonB-dependent receptor plug domain-containing protein [Pseudomonadales bacterium]